MMTIEREYPPLKFIRLKTGEDIICEMIEIGEDEIDTYMVINPYKVVYMSTGSESRQIQIAFMPWVFSRICDKQEFMIKAEDVLFLSDVSDYMLKYYWETMDGPQEDEEERLSPEEEEELKNLEGENFVKNLLEYLGVSGKRTLH